MEALGIWLKELIVIILIATFVELMLPGKSMLRYIRTVIGLFIILTILTPIIRLLTSDFDPDRVLLAALEEPGEHAAAMTSLHTVLRDGNRLREQQENEALDLLKDQLESMMTDDLEGRFPLRVLHLRTEIGARDGGTPSIRRIEATVAWLPGDNHAGREPNDDAAEVLVQVEEIDIGDIVIPPIPESASIPQSPPVPAGQESETTDPARAASSPVREIVEWLSTRWDVDRRGIEIQVLDEKRK